MTRVISFKNENRECFIDDATAEKIETAFYKNGVKWLNIQGKRYSQPDILISPPVDKLLEEEKKNKFMDSNTLQSSIEALREKLVAKGILK
jgi:hypothetical protein